MRFVPQPIVMAMVAGVFLKFGILAVDAFDKELKIALAALVAWIVFSFWKPVARVLPPVLMGTARRRLHGGRGRPVHAQGRTRTSDRPARYHPAGLLEGRASGSGPALARLRARLAECPGHRDSARRRPRPADQHQHLRVRRRLAAVRRLWQRQHLHDRAGQRDPGLDRQCALPLRRRLSVGGAGGRLRPAVAGRDPAGALGAGSLHLHHRRPGHAAGAPAGVHRRLRRPLRHRRDSQPGRDGDRPDPGRGRQPAGHRRALLGAGLRRGDLAAARTPGLCRVDRRRQRGARAAPAGRSGKPRMPKPRRPKR